MLLPDQPIAPLPLHVLRLCSVFEPPDAVLAGAGVRFDPIGGMQNHTAQLSRALARQGVRQTVLTTRPPGAPRHQAFAPGVRVHRHGVRLQPARQLYAPPAALDALRRAPGVDLVHAHLGEDIAVLPIAWAAARRARAPLVMTVHTSVRHTFVPGGPRGRVLKLLGGAVEAWISRHADAVIALTPRLAERLVDGGIPAGRVHVIPSGVVRSDFAGAAADPFPSVPRPRILFAGRLARQKGIATLLEALARCRHPEARLVVVGDGPERAAAEALVRARGLADRVQFAGFRPHREMPAVLAHADVFAMPSVYEELGTVLIEAMQAGLPIVASRTGGIPHALGDAGVLVPPGDAPALAAALDGLLGERERAARLGARARERAAAFDWETLAGQVLDVYRIARGARPVAPPRPEPEGAAVLPG